MLGVEKVDVEGRTDTGTALKGTKTGQRHLCLSTRHRYHIDCEGTLHGS